MAARADRIDLGSLSLGAGEGRRLELTVTVVPLVLAGQRYACDPAVVDAILDVARMTGHGFSLRLRFAGAVAGPCMRCLADARADVAVDAREIDQPGGGEDLESPYVEGTELDLSGWARDAFALAAPAQVLCRLDCAGLCPVCAADLNDEPPGHHHDEPPDPRWAKLDELRLE